MMRTFTQALALVVALSASALTQAASYAYSYDFTSPDKYSGARNWVSGYFDGDVVGHQITHLSKISLSLNGKLQFTNGSASSDAAIFDGFVALNGTAANDFTFFAASTDLNFSGTSDSRLILLGPSWNEEFSNGSFRVSAVPEPASYAMLLTGLGLVAAVAYARRRKAAPLFVTA